MSGSNFSTKHECAGCGDDIHATSLVRIQCTETNLVFCPECFAAGVEVGGHKAHHGYRFMDNGDFSPLNNNWSAKELVQLLDGLEQFGYGNWNDVSRYVKSKTAIDCRDAVNNIFVSGPIGSLTYHEAARGQSVDHTAPTPSQPGPAPSQGSLSLHQLLALGFMPARDDFEMEHENDAEVLVSSIEAGPSLGASARMETEDEELEMSLKLAHVEMYQNKLKERDRRKQVSKNLTLVENFFKENPFNAMTGKLTIQKPKKKDSKQELLDKFKFVSSFMGIEEYKRVLAGVSKEREIKVRIKELLRYRKNGINNLQESESYEAERIKRNKKKADRKKALEAGLPEPVSIEPSPVKEAEADKAVDLDNVASITGLPGSDILSHNERRLCTSLRLHPSLYISYKTCLLRDHLQKKRGQNPKPVHPSGLDKIHRRKIFNFLLTSGWISAY